MNYCDEIAFIPTIPTKLIDCLEIIEQRTNYFPVPEVVSIYASYEVNQDLQDWIQSQFNYPVVARYQVIKQNLPVHVDRGITEFKYNFIVSTGGNDVHTNWWDDLDSPKQIVYSIVAQKNIWYSLNVKTPHNVTNVTEPRISVTVKKQYNE